MYPLNVVKSNTKKLKLFSYKAIVLLIFLGLILFTAILPFAPGLGSDTRYLFTLNELKNKKLQQNYDLGFFGNSFHYTAIDPSLIKSKLGLNALHLNSSAQNIRVSLLTAKEVLKKHDLKYVFFEISGPSLRKVKAKDEKHWFFQAKALQEVPFSFEKVHYTSLYFPKDIYQKYYYSGLSNSLGKLLNLNNRKDYTYKKKYNFETKAYFNYNGYIAKNIKHIDEKKFNETFLGETYKEKTIALWTDDLIDQMDAFITYAAQKDVQVILTYGLKLYPSSMDVRSIDRFRNKYSNLKYLDLNKHRDKYRLSKESYYNESHYNYPASYQVTNRLIDSISEWYSIAKIPKDTIDFNIYKLHDFFYNMDDTQDKFFRIEYTTLPPKIVSDYTFVVGFYPKDTSLLKESSKKRNRISEDYYFNLNKDFIEAGTKKIVIQKMETALTKKDIQKIKMYFYKKNDTLHLPSYTIYPN